jgi:hypothetical protein
VVYQDVTRQAKGLHRLKHVGALERGLAYLSRCNSGWFCHIEYIGAEDPSRMCAEELTDDAALIRVRRVLLEVDAVPYIPQLFFAQNPPKPVSIRLLFV